MLATQKSFPKGYHLFGGEWEAQAVPVTCELCGTAATHYADTPQSGGIGERCRSQFTGRH